MAAKCFLTVKIAKHPKTMLPVLFDQIGTRKEDIPDTYF